MSEIAKQAEGKWPGILRQLGIPDEFLKNKHGPCPICEGKDRYRFDDKNGRGGYYCHGCGAGDGWMLLMKYNNWSFREAATEVESIIGTVDKSKPVQKKDPKFMLRRIYQMLKPIGESEAYKYLISRRLTIIPDDLKSIPAFDYYEDGKKQGRYSAMVGLVVDVDNNPLTYHITYLQNAKKAPVDHPKKIMTPIRSITGGAIRLFGEGDHIYVTEGIETAIAVHSKTSRPVWAAISAGGMEALKLPESVKRVTVCGDNDMSYAGQKAAYALANRLAVREKRDVDVRIPKQVGTDWLDEITGG